MVSLGDFFPNHEKKKAIKRSFIPFQVFYLHCPQLSRPKNKYLLLACDNPLMFFFISKKPRKNLIGKLQQHQIELETATNEFLSRKSFINCAFAVKSLTKTEATLQLRKDMSRIKNPIDQKAQKEVIEAVRQAGTLTRKEKQTILQFLVSS